MVKEQLSSEELIHLIRAVFPKFPDDHRLGILVDIPRNPNTDNPNWTQRRAIAMDWFQALKDHAADMGFERIDLIAYADVGSNNADLPPEAYWITDAMPSDATELKSVGNPISFEEVFRTVQLFLAPTEYSTTAPLKNAAKTHGFRAATMPGFVPEMIPALRIDYNEVARRVTIVKEKVDAASWAETIFIVDHKDECRMFFDLRFRSGHLSSGRFPDKGTAGNLPSGETYIVPYEGERDETSKTAGTLPVQLGTEVVTFTVMGNRAIEVKGDGPAAIDEKNHLTREWAYGNMAELGFGVLGDFGLNPIGEMLLDEKLGFHVAFGRSDHFGGAVGPNDFSSPSEVIHLDRVYIPAVQPRVQIQSIVFGYETNQTETIMENGKYLIFDR
ncbi:MAG: hypothetical protein ACM3SY_00420 [Candidatus Omnitrophota bacterium]